MSNNKQKLLALMSKIKALADKGIDGEREAAQSLLERLMKENNLTEQDIVEDAIKVHEFTYESNKPFTRKLISQIVYSVCGDIDSNKGIYEYVRNTKNRVAIKCTDAEFLEIVAKYEFYIRHLAEDMKLLYKAFIQTNHLYPPEDLTKLDAEPTRQTPEDMKAALLAMGLDKHEYLKQIEGGNND